MSGLPRRERRVKVSVYHVSNCPLGLFEIFAVHTNDFVDDALSDAADGRVFGEVVADDVAEFRRHRRLAVAGAGARHDHLFETLSQRSRINLGVLKTPLKP
jgi:hypothetical protein